jgi:mono/diheme cytochrome c family protein
VSFESRLLGFATLAAAVVLAMLGAACAEPGQASSGPPAQTAAQAGTAQPGETLVRTLECAACHADLPRNTPVSEGRSLGPDFTLSADSVYAVLRQRPAANPGARMPYFHLDEREAVALALYLGRGRLSGALRRIADRAPAVTASQGARTFAALNCAGCHTHPEHRAEPVGPLLAWEGARVRAEWLQAYLRRPHAVRPFGTRPGSGARMPDFALSDAEADSVARFLLRGPPALPALADSELPPHTAAVVDTLMAQRWSCLGCHAWQGRGGRIGPDLAAAAARLRPEYIRALLIDPSRMAPGTVMPKPALPAATLDRVARRMAYANASVTHSPADSLRAGYLSLTEHAPLVRPPEATRAAYAERCAPCHGPDGGGDGYNAAYLRVRPAIHTDSAALSLRPDDTLYDAIAAGAYFLGGSAEMPAFADLEPAVIRALVSHLRTLCRCAPPAWSRDGGRP